MGSLPERYVPKGAAASYYLPRKKLVLRYRLPGETEFKTKTSPYGESEKRLFYGWCRVFLANGGTIPNAWEDAPTQDAKIVESLEQSITVGEAVARHLLACTNGTKNKRPLRAPTLRDQTRPMLLRFEERFGAGTQLRRITGDEIHDFIKSLGGRKATKRRHLGPISALFTWAVRQKLIPGPNPAHGLVFWREEGEKPRPKLVRFYSDVEFRRLLDAAAGDEIALDAIYFGRYLACRRRDMVMLTWEQWNWPALLVEVPRTKTDETAASSSLVDLHQELAERYAARSRDSGYCIEYVRARPRKVSWPNDDELVRRVEAAGRSAVARDLGCSEAAVRKRLKRIQAGAPVRNDDDERSLLADSLTKRVNAITKAAGLYTKGVQPLHVLRHTFASDALGRGIPPATVASWMGIDLQTVMEHYHHLVPRGELQERGTNLWGLTAQKVFSLRNK